MSAGDEAAAAQAGACVSTVGTQKLKLKGHIFVEFYQSGCVLVAGDALWASWKSSGTPKPKRSGSFCTRGAVRASLVNENRD